MAATWRPLVLRIWATLREVWLLPQPVRTAQTETTGFVLLTIVSSGPRRTKRRPGRLDLGGLVHDVLVGDVAVGEVDLGDAVLPDQGVELLFGVDGDAVGVELAGQDGRVLPAVDVGDLGRGEGDDLEVRVVPEIGVEIVEIAPRGAHDDHLFHKNFSLRKASKTKF